MISNTGLITLAALTSAKLEAMYKNGAVGGVTLPIPILVTKIAHM